MVEIRDILEPPPTAAEPQYMGPEILRLAGIERQRVDRKPRDLALLEEPRGGIGIDAGKMHHAARILTDIFRRIDNVPRPAGVHCDAGIVGQSPVPTFPCGKIIA